ncbi:MAG: PKD domain-containing protein [Verrucomicrobiota bacterium]
MVLAIGLASLSLSQAQDGDLFLGFNDAAGPAAAQNDYVIDLGVSGATLIADANAASGTFTLSLDKITSTNFSTTFQAAFHADANDLNHVAVGVIGASISGAYPRSLYLTASAKPNVPSTANYSDAANQDPATGEYASTTSGGWTTEIATSPGTTTAGTVSAYVANPLGQLSAGVITLNLFEETETASGLSQTVGAWTNEGTLTINVNTRTVGFVVGSSSPAPSAGTVSSTVTNGFYPLTVVFTNTASGSITQWVWNFGNGNIITNTTGANVTNTYAADGDYTVSLTVYGPGGSSTNILANYIVTSPVPKINTALVAGQFTLGGTNCPVGVQYRILTSTNLTLPTASWQPVVTNKFLSNGSFSYTNATTNATSFFQLVSP